MFVGPKPHSYYDRDGQQSAKGYYMVWTNVISQQASGPLFDACSGHDVMYATVRCVTMKPLGNFMMATAQIGKKRISLSGSLGSDGLPHTTWVGAYADLERINIWIKRYWEPVPWPICKLWSTNNGHNCVNDHTGLIRAYGTDLYERTYNLRNPAKVFYGHPALPRIQGPLAPIPRGKTTDWVGLYNRAVGGSADQGGQPAEGVPGSGVLSHV